MRAAGNERTVEFPAAFYFTKQVLLLTKNLFSFIMISQLTDQSVGKIQLKRKRNGGGYDIKIQCKTGHSTISGDFVEYKARFPHSQSGCE